MAQAGYTPILIYASGTATNIPTAGNLISGSSGAELAINYADGKLYYKDSSGNVKLLSIGYGSSSVTPTNGGVQYGTGTALALTAAGSSGQILRSNGAAAPTWADLSTLGVNTISFGTTGLTPNSATAGAVTVAGTLVTANGGTGLGGATPFTANGVLYASSASALTSGSALTFDGTTFTYGAGGSATTNTAFTLNGTDNAAYGTGVLGKRNGTNTWFIGDTAWALGSGTGVINYNYGTAPWIWYLQTGGEQMRLTSTGLGIGTSSPGVKLDVSGAAASAAITGSITNTDASGFSVLRLRNTGASGKEYQIVVGGHSSASVDNFYIYDATAAAVRLTLDSSGNLGLGVTPSAWQWAAFQTQRASLAGGVNDRTDLAQNYFRNGGANQDQFIGTGYATLYRQISGQHQWQVSTASGSAGGAITFTQAMTLDASGRLGVGATSPTAQLVVQGTGAGGWLVGARNVVQLYNPNTTATNVSNGIIFGDASNSTRWAIYNDLVANGSEANVLAFVNLGTERARITSGGSLLVGTTAQIGNERFGVDSGSGACGKFKGGTSANVTIDAWNPATTGDNIFVAFRTETAETTRGTITYNRTAGLVAYNTTSDYRAKDILGPVANPGATIDALKVYEGKMKGATQSRPMLVAHEAQAHAPYAVTGEKDAFNEDGTPKFQQIDVSSLVPLLLAEIQSLRQRVALLEGN